MDATVDLDHELGARLNELRPRPVVVAQVGVRWDDVGFGDLHCSLDTSLGFRVSRHTRRDRDHVVMADLNDQRMAHSDPSDVPRRHCAFVVRQPVRRHTTKRLHRTIQARDHRRQRFVPHRQHDPEPAPRQPRTEQECLSASDHGAVTPVPLRPHPRLHDPRPIHTPAARFPVQLHDRERPAHRAVRPFEAEPDKLVEHDITTHLAVGPFHPFLDLGHEPVDQLRSLRRRHTVR
jgi:hypothetical protein